MYSIQVTNVRIIYCAAISAHYVASECANFHHYDLQFFEYFPLFNNLEET